MISFKLFAGTCTGLRDNNEDNFVVCPDLLRGEWMVPANQQAIPLGHLGSLVVVADGMGGQNAGEVASDIAIRTVQQMFAPEALSADVATSASARNAHLKKVIVEADIRVKAYGDAHHEASGLGSTIVMAWLIGTTVHVAWLGDSRAYSYVPDKGIGRLSKDHSYVQQLVDAGTLTDEEAMNHPNSNVITRSLGDNSQKAKPEVVVHNVVDGEVILLCTDGLCGVCTDSEIGGIISRDINDLQACKETLTEAALNAGGSDNITVALLQVRIDSTDAEATEQTTPPFSQTNKKMLIGIIGGVIAFAVAIVGYFMMSKEMSREPQKMSLKLIVDDEGKPLARGSMVRYHTEVTGGESECHFLLSDKDKEKIEIRSDSFIYVNSEYWPEKNDIVAIIAYCEKDTTVCDTIKIALMYERKIDGDTINEITTPPIINTVIPIININNEDSNKNKVNTTGKKEGGGGSLSIVPPPEQTGVDW